MPVHGQRCHSGSEAPAKTELGQLAIESVVVLDTEAEAICCAVATVEANVPLSNNRKRVEKPSKRKSDLPVNE